MIKRLGWFFSSFLRPSVSKICLCKDSLFVPPSSCLLLPSLSPIPFLFVFLVGIFVSFVRFGRVHGHLDRFPNLTPFVDPFCLCSKLV
jgi:hypothetical protein